MFNDQYERLSDSFRPGYEVSQREAILRCWRVIRLFWVLKKVKPGMRVCGF
jgi:hypothetical protein